MALFLCCSVYANRRLVKISLVETNEQSAGYARKRALPGANVLDFASL